MLLDFLENQRILAFVGALLLALAGWGADFKSWGELFQISHVFGLLLILGGLVTTWATKRPDFLKRAEDCLRKTREVKP